MPFCVPFWYTWPPDQTHHWHNLLSWQHQRINSMDQSSAWKVNNSSAGLAIHGIFRNSSSLCSQKPDTCHSSEPDQSNPPLPNQILDDPFMPRSSKWSPSLMFPHQNPLCTSPLPTCDTCPIHVILLDHKINHNNNNLSDFSVLYQKCSGFAYGNIF